MGQWAVDAFLEGGAQVQEVSQQQGQLGMLHTCRAGSGRDVSGVRGLRALDRGRH